MINLGKTPKRIGLLVSLVVLLSGCSGSVSPLEAIWWETIGFAPNPALVLEKTSTCEPDCEKLKRERSKALEEASGKFREFVVTKFGSDYELSTDRFVAALSKYGFECVRYQSLVCRSTTFHAGYYLTHKPDASWSERTAIDWWVFVTVRDGQVFRSDVRVQVQDFGISVFEVQLS